jgi:hypothetical protein
VARDEIREVEFETRTEAASAVVLVICLQVFVALVSLQQRWSLWHLPWWIWLALVVPELALLVALNWSRPRRRIKERGMRRTAALALVGAVSVGNGLALVALIGSLVTGAEKSGGQLLLKGIVIWSTNIVAFGLWFWEIDGGGPIRRAEPPPLAPDFLFPQMDRSGEAAGGWYPRLVDYVYVSFTNALAFSPTDTMPLSRRAKILMLIEAALSALTILLVAARAVNILK